MSFIKEFKDFAMRGNVVDMAVGVVIGGAFGKIVSSLVADVLMPLIGTVVGGVNFASLKWVISEAVMEGEKVIKPEASLNYGNFIQIVIDFILIAFSVFVVIKLINKVNKKKEAAPAPAPEPPADVKLLTEIRDLLKNK